MAGNANLRAADKNKQDEFYTRLVDIENELKHYKNHFKDKVVLCNCDDPRVSNFFHYFSYNFEVLGLKKLITTCYKNQNRDLFSQNDSERAIWLEYFGDKNGNRVPDPEEIGIHYFKGDGDFRSEECVELLKEADIVVTNPPFSLFREYISQLMHYDKRFVIIGNQNAISYKEVFSLMKQDKLWLGYTFPKLFRISDNITGKNIKIVDNIKYQQFGNIGWFTNLDISKRHEDVILYKMYNPEEYPKFDNYDAINIDRTADIPMDYNGLMGVPISFLDKYNPSQFEIVEGLNRYTILDVDGRNEWARKNHIHFTCINGQPKYFRIIIRRRQNNIVDYQQQESELPMAAEEQAKYNKI